MQSKVTIRGESPRIVEEARAQQILNRQRLNSRTVTDRIKREAVRRYEASKQKGLAIGVKEGGQLEFKPRNVRKIRVTRRFSERGFLLLPSSGFDAEGKIYVRSAYESSPYSYPTLLPFNFANNRLEPAIHPASKALNVGQETTGDVAAGAMEYPGLQSIQESFNQATIECFVYLESSEEMPPTYEDLGGIGRTTIYKAEVFLTIGSYYTILPLYKSDIMPVVGAPGELNSGIESNWSYRTQGQQLNLAVATGTYHFAATFANGQMRRFFNGNLIEVNPAPPNLSLASLNFDLSMLIYKRQIVSTTGPLGGYVISDECSLISLKAGISSIRFTPGADLYPSTSFTPPTSITELA